MYNHIERMKDRLTDNYNKSDNSDVMKIIHMMGEGSNENERSYALMKDYQDIDKARGQSLDMKGENVGLSRGGMDDETYRKLIKIQILANLSNGDIPTLNKIFKAYLGDYFIGLNEGWAHPLAREATLVLKIKDNTPSVPVDKFQTIIGGGIQLFIVAEDIADTIILSGYSYGFEVLYPICGTFYTAPKDGAMVDSTISVEAETYGFDVDYPVCGTFRTAAMTKEYAFTGAQILVYLREVEENG